MQTETKPSEYEKLKDYLRGMKKSRPDSLVQLQLVPRWQELAERELERRATSLIQAFHNSLLTAIANDEVNVHQAIKEVLASK